MRSRLFQHVKQKELAERRELTIAQIAKETSLSRNTIAAWLSQEPFARIEVHSALVLADWLGCNWYELCELVEVSESEN